MKITKRILAVVGMTVAVATASAVPAFRSIRTITQPDGSTLKIKVVGDEHLHFTTTEDGTLIQLDEKGFYRIAKIESDGAIVSSGIALGDPSASAVAVKLNDLNIDSLQAKRNSKRKAPQTGYGLSSASYPRTGSPKGLIILVEYSDVKFHSTSSYNAKEYFNDMINGENFTQFRGTGSALEYFTEQSGGKFTPDFDVLGPVTLPNTQKYYGGNDRYGDDANAHLMVTDAIQILDPTVDFSVYDTDGDGLIDNVYVFYAGQGEADYGSANTVWPHSWDVRYGGVNKKVDGVYVAQYACSNEWSLSTPNGVGTFIHEFSHVMGLPDLYHTTSASADYTPDAYSVLDYGPYNNDGRTPPNYGAYEKNAMGWFEPIMLDHPLSVELDQISSGQFGLIPTEKTTEFFLLENRQQTGWDKYIPNHGMLIWHIDYVPSIFDANTVNNNKNHQYVDIEEANNRTGSSYLKGYTFPGTSGKTSFTSSTTPALKSWAGKAIDLPVTEITEKNGMIYFDIAGGGVPELPLAAPQPFVCEYSEKDSYFIAEWPSVEGATEYFITVYAGDGTEAGAIATGFDGSVLADDWTASATGWYTTASNYGDSAPSYKFSSDGQTLSSPILPSGVSSIEFWAKGQGSGLGTLLAIEGMTDNGWTPILEYTPLNNKAENVVITDVPSNTRQIRFTMEKSKGNIAVDDITIHYGGGLNVLPDYANISVGDATRFIVDKLKEGEHSYSFIVAATNGNQTATSELCKVIIQGESNPAGVDSINDSDVITEYYNLQGIKIENPARGEIVIERKGNTVRKIVIL